MAFYAITRACDDSTRIYGAARTDRSHVVHFVVVARDANERFWKSKYVQSDITGSYIRKRSELKEGTEVIFVGTPCHVAGLKIYLDRDYDKLLTSDLVCHGVSDSEVLEKCLRCYDKIDDKVPQVIFRHNRGADGKWNSALLKLVYQSGKSIIVLQHLCISPRI